MGPHVSDDLTQWTLKPFQSSTTFRNLRAANRCVVNVIDDSMLLALAVTGQANTAPFCFIDGSGFVLKQACHWYALSIQSWDVSQSRAIANCEVQSTGIERPFFGWNRAKHAVVELAILTSRIDMLAPESIQSEIDRLQILIDKTAGTSETDAFQLLVDWIHSHTRENIDANPSVRSRL